MSPFTNSPGPARPPLSSRFAAHPALVAFLFCLACGGAIVLWRAHGRAEAGRAAVQAEAGVRAELELNGMLSAVEVLAELVRQSGGGMASFERVAGDLFKTRPWLASLELQPGGVVREILPRVGQERAIGLSVLTTPAYRAGASAAIQRRAVTVTGPVGLYRGGAGIVAQAPVFLRTREGKEAFWGFAAASMGLPEGLTRAQLDGLVRQPGASHGLGLSQALQASGAWAQRVIVVLECLAVLGFAGVLSLAVSLMQSRRQAEEALTSVSRELAREGAERKQAQEESRTVKDGAAAAQTELKRTKSALQQAETMLKEAQSRLEAAVRDAGQSSEEVKKAQLKASDLESQLQAAVQTGADALQAKQKELDQSKAKLGQAEGKARELHERMANAARAEQEAASVEKKSLQQEQKAVADLQARLDAAVRSAGREAEVNAAKIKELEQGNQQLRARLLAVEQMPAERAEEQPASNKNDPKPAEASEAPEPRPIPLATSASEAQAAAPPRTDEAAPEARASEPPAKRRPAATAERRKRHRDEQMDLFGAGQRAEPPLPAGDGEPQQRAESGGPEVPEVEGAMADGSGLGEEPELASVSKPKATRAVPAQALPAAPPINSGQWRKAANQILPLLIDQDPGAKDCLKDNRSVFRSAFTPEGYAEFEQSVKSGDSTAALEQLRSAARHHGISL